MTLQLESSEPPEFLYHGTARGFVDSIQKKGLLPGGRRYVHLGLTEKQAHQVGKRRDSKPAILTVRAGEVYREGLDFYLLGDVYLVEFVPPQFIVTSDPDEV